MGDRHSGEMKRESAEAKTPRLDASRIAPAPENPPRQTRSPPACSSARKNAKTGLQSAKNQGIAMNEHLLFQFDHFPVL
jgi:hypothetical protein